MQVLIDLDRSTLAFSVNGGEPHDAGIVLPPAVMPWCLLTYRGDAVTLPVARAVRDGMIWLMHVRALLDAATCCYMRLHTVTRGLVRVRTRG